MSSYYVAHPNLSLTALIDAPSTEKARTTFLDYLERRGQVARADRQYWRKNMVAEKMADPSEVQADVELHYGYQEGGQQMPPSMTATPSYGDEERQAYYDRDEIPPADATAGVPYAGRIPETTEQRLDYEQRLQESEMEFPREEEPVRPTQPFPAASGNMSPIQKLALGGHNK